MFYWVWDYKYVPRSSFSLSLNFTVELLSCRVGLSHNEVLSQVMVKGTWFSHSVSLNYETALIGKCLLVIMYAQIDLGLMTV